MTNQIVTKLVDLKLARKLLSTKEAREQDSYNINTLKVPSQILMEAAGAKVAKYAQKWLGKIRRPNKTQALIFAGCGNKGGDALVCARHLMSQNIPTTIFFVFPRDKFCAELKKQLAIINEISVAHDGSPSIKTIGETKVFWAGASAGANTNASADANASATLIIDGIFGAGLSRMPAGAALNAIDAINNIRASATDKCYVISIDIPSGLSLDAQAPLGSHVIADETITFGDLKRAHVSEPTKKFCGRTTALPIGLFPAAKASAYLIKSKRVLSELLTPMPKTCHKGNFGHVLIAQGHDNYLGASRLAALAALRTGAGLVTITSKDQSVMHAQDRAEFMKCPQKDLSDAFLQKFDAAVLGPGLSREKTFLDYAAALANKIAPHINTLVLDADGLILLKQKQLSQSFNTIICTPHSAEAASLLDCSVESIEADRFFAIEKLAALNFGAQNIIWVLKGATPLVHMRHHEIFVFTGDLPILSIGGSGDVLAGAIAGLIKQCSSPMAATLLAISLQLSAAHHKSIEAGKGVLPSEIAEVFPRLLVRDFTSN